MNKSRDERDGAFGISVYGQDLIEENAHERFGEEYGDPETRSQMMQFGFIDDEGTPTETGYRQLEKDIATLENNSLKWLKDTFNHVRDEGHSNDELVGAFWWDPTNKKQLEQLLIGLHERIDMSDASWGSLANVVWKGVSGFGQNVLGGQISFSGVDESEVEDLYQAQDKKKPKARRRRK